VELRTVTEVDTIRYSFATNCLYGPHCYLIRIEPFIEMEDSHYRLLPTGYSLYFTKKIVWT
jgi:hypothetical protein